MKLNWTKLAAYVFIFIYSSLIVVANNMDSVSNDKIDPKLKIERKNNDPGGKSPSNGREEVKSNEVQVAESENNKKNSDLNNNSNENNNKNNDSGNKNTKSEKEVSKSNKDFDKVFDDIKGKKNNKTSFFESHNIFIIGCTYIVLGLVLLGVFIYRIKSMSVVKSRRIKKKI